MRLADPIQLVQLLLQIRRLKPTTLAHVACKQKIIQEAKKSAKWIEFTSSYYYTKLGMSFIGSFELLSIPPNQRGYLKPFRNHEIVLICIHSGERWTRGYIACLIDASKLAHARTIYNDWKEQNKKAVVPKQEVCKPVAPKEVICIDVSNPKQPHLFKPEHYISIGEIYTVNSSYLDQSDAHEYYYLEEKLNLDPRPSYRANRFISIDDVDELIMREQWLLEAYKQKMFAVKSGQTSSNLTTDEDRKQKQINE